MDRTALQLTFVHVPPADVRSVLGVLERHDLDLEFNDPDQPMPATDTVALNGSYVNFEIACGSAQAIAEELINTAPGAAWEVWEDPKYDWLGGIFRFTPHLGLWSGECSSQGDALFTAENIAQLCDDATLSRADVDHRLGITHGNALAALSPSARGEELRRRVHRITGVTGGFTSIRQP